MTEAVHRRRKTEDGGHAEHFPVPGPQVGLADVIPEEERRVPEEDLLVPGPGHEDALEELPHADLKGRHELDVVAAEENQARSRQQNAEEKKLPPERGTAEDISQGLGMFPPPQVGEQHQERRKKERRLHAGESPEAEHVGGLAEEGGDGQPPRHGEEETSHEPRPGAPPPVKGQEGRLGNHEHRREGPDDPGCRRNETDSESRDEDDCPEKKGSFPGNPARPPVVVCAGEKEKPPEILEEGVDKGEGQGRSAGQSRPPGREGFGPGNGYAVGRKPRREVPKLPEEGAVGVGGGFHGGGTEDEQADGPFLDRPEKPFEQGGPGDVPAEEFLVGHAVERQQGGKSKPVELGGAELAGELHHRHGAVRFLHRSGEGLQIGKSEGRLSCGGESPDGRKIGEQSVKGGHRGRRIPRKSGGYPVEYGNPQLFRQEQSVHVGKNTRQEQFLQGSGKINRRSSVGFRRTHAGKTGRQVGQGLPSGGERLREKEGRRRKRCCQGLPRPVGQPRSSAVIEGQNAEGELGTGQLRNHEPRGALPGHVPPGRLRGPACGRPKGGHVPEVEDYTRVPGCPLRSHAGQQGDGGKEEQGEDNTEPEVDSGSFGREQSLLHCVFLHWSATEKPRDSSILLSLQRGRPTTLK
ncbi:hypothetical protein SDC9_39375 [bioreactor metagenome]|uniref:Uncharacterized protein n=1 Tax=bioreactor metagenome TaxID=1076179 RepID=A0A644VPD4_9ZZZZ